MSGLARINHQKNFPPILATWSRSLSPPIDAFREVPDPRHPKGRRYPLPEMLDLIALGLLMGARDILDIWRKVAPLSQSHRDAIGLRVRDKHTKLLRMPGHDALNDLLAAVDPAAYAVALTAWLQANAGVLPPQPCH